MPDALERTSEAPLGESLVAAAMRGDREALRALWEENRRWIAAVLLAHKPRFEDLEDLLQEVAVTFVSKISTLREETNLRAWLRTIAINAARAAGRSGKYRQTGDLPSELPDVNGNGGADAGDGVEKHLALGEHARRMLDRVQGLPEGYREPLLLRAMRGMRSRQIGELLGIPPATVDTRIARARKMLRQADEAGMSQSELDSVWNHRFASVGDDDEEA